MITRIQKWGNSQGLRLSKELLSTAGLNTGEEVEVLLLDGTITISPVRRVRGRHNIRELVRRIRKGYKPGELGWGAPIGKEVW